jgi:signal transduction histidine kinase
VIPSHIPLAPAPAPRAHPALAATAQIAIGIAPKPSEVRRVRNEVAAALAAWRIPRATDLVLLVVSELVTNAIRHAPCSEIQVAATYGDGVLLVEVRDGAGRPHAGHRS